MIRKIHFLMLACLVSVAVLIVSCGRKADYRDALPSDASLTMSMNLALLLQKSGAVDIEQSSFYAQVQAELEKNVQFSAEEKEYIHSLLKNPGESGIDMANDLFVFASLSGDAVESVKGACGLLLPISDKAKLDDLIGRINQKTGSKSEVDGNVTFVRTGSSDDMNAVFAYTKTACMFYFAPNSSEEVVATVKKLFAQKPEESLMGNKTVAEYLAVKNDINMVLSYKNMSALINNPMMTSMPMMDVLLGATMLCSVNFEQGRITSDTKIAYKDAESEKKVMDFYCYVKPQTGALLRYTPAGTIGALGLGLVGEKLFTVLSSMPGYGMLLANPMIKQVMGGFDGDFIVSFSGMAPGGIAPFASVLAQVKDANLLQPVIANLGSMPIQKMGENEYMLSMGGVSILFGVKDNVLYCTTDAAVKSALDGAKIESLTSLEKIFKGQVGTFYLDFKGVSNMATQMIGGAGNKQTDMMLSVLSIFDNMECYGTMEGAKMVVNMVDKEQNALKTICDKGGELMRQFQSQANL